MKMVPTTGRWHKRALGEHLVALESGTVDRMCILGEDLWDLEKIVQNSTNAHPRMSHLHMGHPRMSHLDMSHPRMSHPRMRGRIRNSTKAEILNLVLVK